MLDYHSQCTEVLKGLTETLLAKYVYKMRYQLLYCINFILNFRKDEAANRPKMEFVPKTLGDLNIEGVSDGVNGTNHHSSSISHLNSKMHTKPLPKPYPKHKSDPFDCWDPVAGIFFFFSFYYLYFIYIIDLFLISFN